MWIASSRLHSALFLRVCRFQKSYIIIFSFPVEAGTLFFICPVLLDISVTREAVKDFIMYYPGIDIGLTRASITLDFTFALQCMSGAEAILLTLDLIALDSAEGRRCVGVITLLNSVVA